MREPYDRSSKWLLTHYGAALLRLGGIANVLSCRALAPEVVQTRQLPDGLRAALAVLFDRDELPEVLALVLHPKGTFQIENTEEMASALGTTHLQLRWRVVEMWKLQAADLLAIEDVGIIPWVPLTQITGPPEPVLHQCRQRIDQQAPLDEKANLLAVTQVLARLRYNDPQLLQVFGGSQAMIESPLIQEIESRARCEGRRRSIELMLKGRFGLVPQELLAQIQVTADEDKLIRLAELAGQCTTLKAFQAEAS